MLRSVLLLVTLAVTLAVIGCSPSRRSPAPPPSAFSLVLLDGDWQHGPVGAPVAWPCRVFVPFAVPAAGIPVSFRWFARGTGDQVVLTDASGVASAIVSPLARGPATLTARVEGAHGETSNAVTFTVTGD